MENFLACGPYFIIRDCLIRLNLAAKFCVDKFFALFVVVIIVSPDFVVFKFSGFEMTSFSDEGLLSSVLRAAIFTKDLQHDVRIESFRVVSYTF